MKTPPKLVTFGFLFLQEAFRYNYLCPQIDHALPIPTSKKPPLGCGV